MGMGLETSLGPINLGNPQENTVLELAHLVTRIVGGLGQIEFLKLPEDDPKQRKPDITKARKLLGWEPSVSLEAGIKETAEWISGRLAEY
jgi:nucleoside-diphosphate-sugar epimerase